MSEKVWPSGEATFTAAGGLSYFMRRDDSDLVVFCFAKPEDAGGLGQASVGSYSGRITGQPVALRVTGTPLSMADTAPRRLPGDARSESLFPPCAPWRAKSG